MTRRAIDERAVRAWWRQGLADTEIASLAGCTSAGVQRLRQRLGLAANTRRGRRPRAAEVAGAARLAAIIEGQRS